jgi:hypothetical protein
MKGVSCLVRLETRGCSHSSQIQQLVSSRNVYPFHSSQILFIAVMHVHMFTCTQTSWIVKPHSFYCLLFLKFWITIRRWHSSSSPLHNKPHFYSGRSRLDTRPLQSVHSGVGANKASYSIGTGGSFLGGKAAGVCIWSLIAVYYRS